jgi:putative membrane-bound dehydrogenase-like protein
MRPRTLPHITMKAAIFLILALALVPWRAVSKDEPLMIVGVASVDITPSYPVRLHGYGNRKTNSQGVAQHLFAKALAFGADRQGASILFTVDNLAVSGAVTDEVAARLKKRAGISREQISLCSSHTHSAPMLTGVAPNIFSSDIIPEQQAAIDRYTRELVDNLERVALAALSNRAPSKVSWSEGRVTFAKNRRVIRDGRAVFGDNDTAPVDHSLPTMFVHGADGKLRAVLVNYACHCTTLGGEWNQIHGDWSGYAQEAVQRENPGAIALVSIGCGADANPSPRGKLEYAEAHGNEIAAEVRRLLATSGKPLTKLPDGKVKRFNLDFDPLPTRAQWEERAAKPGIVGYHAKKNLVRLDRGEKLPTKLPYIVQSWTFGDELAMVFLAGEVVVDYERRLKREFDDTRLWVNGYANDVPCYIPSRRILSEGGYEAEDSLWYYDRPTRLAMSSEDRIVKAVHDLLPGKFRATTRRAEGVPLSPREALNSMRVAPEFAVELVAAEPLIVDPVAIDWSADGKLWVAEMRDYPMGLDGKWKPGGTVRLLEDKNGDGHYDKATLFLDGLPFPTGVFAWRKGVLICAAPDILYAEDTNGDGRADGLQKIFTGFATNNYQARVNSLSLGLDGWVYGANGLLGGKIQYVGTPFNSTMPLAISLTGELDIRGRDFRMNPDIGAFEPVSGLTQQGRVRDDFGNWFGCDNSHLLWQYPLGDEYVRRNPHVAAPNPAVHVPQGRDWNRLFPASKTLERFNDPNAANRVTSACGLEIYRDELLGKEFYGNAFTCEPVHNLVHREVLARAGVTFRSSRATNELNREFLASADNWFRPVQARTGPDGALWIVDMYRQVIEHPRWIPSNRLAQLDVRAGDNKGRIYRVYRKDGPPRRIRNLTKLPTPELALALDSPSGTERDRVHRELLNRDDRTALSNLRQLASKDSRPSVRVQAAFAIDSLAGMTPQELGDRLHRESDPQARAGLLRLAGHTPNVLMEIQGGLRDDDMSVRFQAVLAMHGHDAAAQHLLQMLPEAATNLWMRSALLSSSAACAGKLLALAPGLAEQIGSQELFRGLLATAAATGSAADLEQTISALAPTNETQVSAGRFGALAVLAKRTPMESWKSGPANTAVDFARTIVADAQRNVALRRAALGFLSAASLADSSFDWLRQLLKPGPLQGAAIDAVLQRTNGGVLRLLFEEWPTFAPGDRIRIVEQIATRPGGDVALLDAVERKMIAGAEIPLLVRNHMLAAPNSPAREQAQKLWPARVSNRAKLVSDYRKALSANGSSERGVVVFNNNCATCHLLAGKGTAVGPDLTPLRQKSADDFLVAILDPNAAIEPRYVNYVVQTKSGGIFYGVIRSETATSIEIVAPGIHETLLRTDIAKIEAAPTSLMPEGLEQNISPAEMSDLLAFMRKAAPAVFGAATAEQVRAARRAFAAEPANGFGKLLSASERLEYPSWLGRLPLLHCRQTDGRARVSWQPTSAVVAGDAYVFKVPAAMGLVSQPAGKFTFKVNGKSAIEFNVALNDESWQSDGGKVRMSYHVMEANAEDSNGVLVIAVARELAKPDELMTFEVIGSAANSQRWFGIYDITELTRSSRAAAVSN